MCISLFGPGHIGFQTEFDVEELAGAGNAEGGAVAGFHAGEWACALAYHVSVGDDGVIKFEDIGKVGEGKFVRDSQRAVAPRYLGRLVHLLHLSEFGTPCAVGTDDAVVDEVALMRSRHVVARDVVVVAVGLLPDVCRVVDALVYPVPDASSDAVAAAFDDVPVFLEVSDGITHGVCIFAHEIGFRRRVRRRLYGTDGGVHHRLQVGIGRSAACGAFIVNRAGVERLAAVVGALEIAARTAFVAEAPENDGGMVAVAVDHAFRAVEELVFP